MIKKKEIFLIDVPDRFRYTGVKSDVNSARNRKLGRISEGAPVHMREFCLFCALSIKLRVCFESRGVIFNDFTILRGTTAIRTCDQHKNLDIPLCLLAIFGPDYHVYPGKYTS